MSVLKLKDDFDYLRIFKDARVEDISANTSFTDVVWDNNDEVDTGSFGFSNGSADITLKGNIGDYFLITSNVRLDQDANSSTRQNYESRLTLDGAEIPGTRVTTYPRGNSNSNAVFNGTLTYAGLVQKQSSSDETLNVEVRRESQGSAATDIVANETALTAVALPAAAHYISLTSTSSQALPTSQTALSFDEQRDVETAAFSHSTTSNPSRVNIDLAGDYLFFSNVYTSRTTNADRDPVRVDWRLDGSTVLGYGGHGSFNRGDQSTTGSYTGGSAGGLILPGLTDAQFLEVTAFDEEDTSQSDIEAGQLAVQGVELSLLFQTNTEVAATGTHATAIGIPSTDVYQGGTFIVSENTASRNITDITITESGSVDAQNGLDNIKVLYDLDTSAPFNCVSETFDGTEDQFGDTDTNGFSGVDGVSSFTAVGAVTISPTQTLCGYVVYDVAASATDGETVIISIDDPSNDVVTSGGGSVGPGSAQTPLGSTTLENAELTQTAYRWLDDDGVEGSATAIEAENTPTSGFANGTIRRLRTQVNAVGSTSSIPTTFQLDYATKTASVCGDLTNWVDVGDSGGAWDMSNSGFITDGTNATDIGTGSGGVTNPGGQTFLSTNGGLRDTSSQTGSLTLSSTNFVEFEFAIEPTATAPQGNTYCFRVSDAGDDLRGYDEYAEGTISADVDVAATGAQTASVDVGATAQDLGGTYVISRTGTNRAVTSITVSEIGTVDAQSNLSNITLEYDVDTSVPANCESESNDGDESTYGSVDVDGFSGPNGTSTFSAIESVGTNRTLCFYVVVDVGSGAVDGETIEVEITNPSVEVIVLSSSVAPSSVVSPTGSTTVNGPVRTQTHYHWRNDDGDESDAGATSATGGVEDTPITAVPKETTQRLRLQVSNEGGVAAPAASFVLEFGTKITTCDAVGSWNNVGAPGGAFDMSLSSNIADGNTTDIDNAANGAMTEENTTFVGTGALRETEATTSPIALSSTQYTELEFSIAATIDAGDDTTYCFRVSDQGTALSAYDVFAELTTREKQDFFIQRGTEVVTGTGVTLTAGVDYTAPSATSSAFVRISNSHMTGAADNIGTNGQQADDVTAYISDQADITSSFTIGRPSSATSNTRVDWEIIEFVGLAGTDNEMKVRGVGEVAFAATEFTNSGATTDSVINDDDVVVFITGQQNQDQGTGQYNDGLFTATWSTTTGQAEFQRGDADVAADVSYAVVEFTGANWNTQRVEHVYTTAGVAETESMSAIGSVTRAFAHSQKRVGEGLSSIDEGGHLVEITSVGAVSFELRNTAQTPSDHVSVAWVIENTQTGDGALTTYRSSGDLNDPDPEPAFYITGIGATVNPANASIWGTNHTSGTGTTYPRLQTGFTVTSTTEYVIYRSDTNNDMTFQVEVIEWPVAEISIRQNYYRFYVDNDAIDPTDPWPAGGADLGENTSITGADDPLGEGERVRIRMSLLINNASLPENIESFKLQFARLDTTCSAITELNWSDLGDPGSGAIWRGFDGTPVDGTELATSTPATGRLNLSLSDVAGTYEERNNSAVNPHLVDIGEDVEYDWHVEHNGATQRSDYCFRMVESDGTTLDGYINYPTLRTTGYTPVSDTWQWFDDATNVTPGTALAGEEIAPTDIALENEIKLRVLASEVESAAGENVKFTLQFSDFADFSSNVEFLTATSSCVASSTWCYADGAGVDGALIDSAVLSTADSCIAGVGNGCGTHNEASTTPSTLTQPALSNMEFEFTLEHRAARAGGIYYFRLYDVTNDEPVVASSTFPSLAVLGPQLTFTAAAVGSGTVTEGITADVDTTPTAIPFGSVPFDTEHEAVYRMTVDTSATEGYQLLMYARQPLTNVYGGTIADVTGTNASPVAWSTGCSVSADACFGYHTGDDILSGGSTRFSPNDSYARVSTTTPDEIMAASSPTEDTVDIVYKIQVREGQPAGDYETEIVYIAVPVF